MNVGLCRQKAVARLEANALPGIFGHVPCTETIRLIPSEALN